MPYLVTAGVKNVVTDSRTLIEGLSQDIRLNFYYTFGDASSSYTYSYTITYGTADGSDVTFASVSGSDTLTGNNEVLIDTTVPMTACSKGWKRSHLH